MSDGTVLRAEFLLDSSVTFLNHGSFGACPRAVFERYQQWQLELERQPVLFLARQLDELLAEVRSTRTTTPETVTSGSSIPAKRPADVHRVCE